MRRTTIALFAAALCAAVGACGTRESDADAGADAAPDAASAPGVLATDGCTQSPGNAEIPGNGCDDDGDGTVDVVATCDTGISPQGDAAAFARALDLCQTATGASDTHWGVVSAEYKGSFSTNTAPERGQTGILTRFGDVVAPRGGASFGVLSTGWARAFDDPDPNAASGAFQGGVTMQPSSAVDDAPPGFPRQAGACPISAIVTDFISVKLVIKVPDNAHGLKLDFDFWSGEWPEFVCSEYNDAFVAYLTTKAWDGGASENISFDPQNDPVSVNNGFFDRCTPRATVGCRGSGGLATISSCPAGEDELKGTGFYAPDAYCPGSTALTSGGGATGWLTSTAPVQPGELITLELMIWDTGDPNYDSSVLLDHFEWLLGPTDTGTSRPPR